MPTTVTHGQEASGAMYVQNVGPGDAGPFGVEIYGGCTGEVFSDAPKEVAGLAPGADKYISVKFTFDNTGDCYVGAAVDSDHQVAELNEDNNDYQVAVTSQ